MTLILLTASLKFSLNAIPRRKCGLLGKLFKENGKGLYGGKIEGKVR